MHSKAAMSSAEIAHFHPFVDRCDQYIGESDLDDMQRSWQQDLFLLPDQKTLTGIFGDRKFNRINAIIRKAFDFDLKPYQRMSPFFIVPILQDKVLVARDRRSLDESLWSMAKQKEKHLIGLETSQEQRDIYLKIPQEYQVKLLPQIARMPNRFKRKSQRMLDMYRGQQHEQLYRTSRRELGELRKSMLYSRNHIMTTRLITHLSSKSTFCTVGAAHLGGNLGMRALLMRNGVKMKALFCYWLN